MILAMTLMVRDEADIIEAMLQHHRAQGVDVIIVTDNGSVDGTLDVLRSYARDGFVDLREDPVHAKQQGQVVTGMARDAYTLHHADWVLNADADEFWVPVDRTQTLKTVFERMPKELQAFTVPVIDMIGPPAASGSGLSRLIYRDTRPIEGLHEVGLLSHSTHDAAHIGTADVTVAQGNHYVSLESKGLPSDDLAVEVLHLPWRSWEQYSGKVERAGLAYEFSNLTPSPNHHGMRDYRRLKDGTLFAYYVARHPDASELAAGIAAGTLTEDTVLAGLPAVPDEALDPAREEAARQSARVVIALQARVEELEAQQRELTQMLKATAAENESLGDTLQTQAHEIESLRAQVTAFNNRATVKLIDGVADRARKLRHRKD